MKSEAYVTLARNYSIVLVVAAVIGVEKTWDYVAANSLRGDARRAVAEQVFADFALTNGVKPTNSNEVLSAKEIWNKLPASPGGGWRLFQGTYVYDDPIIGFVSIKSNSVVAVRTTWDGEPKWEAQVRTFTESQSNRLGRLSGIFAKVWQKQPGTNDCPKIYSEIEYGVFHNQSAEIPGMGLRFGLRLAPWAFACLILGLLVQVQSQLRVIVADDSVGVGEPWLVLDGTRGLEVIAAVGWGGMIVCSPFIAIACLGSVVWSEFHVVGSMGLPSAAWLQIVPASLLALAGAELSWTVGKLLLLARKNRSAVHGLTTNPCWFERVLGWIVRLLLWVRGSLGRRKRLHPPPPAVASLIALTLLTTAAGMARAEFNQELRGELLRTLSPIFISHAPNECPPVNPSFFAERARILDTHADKWIPRTGGDERWTAVQFLEWLQAGDPARQSADLKISPEGWRRDGTVAEGAERARRSTEAAIREGHGVFGHVSHLGGDQYSVKYFLFLTWNETAYVGGEGNHEGDWLCLDFQVTATDPRQPRIEYALYHNHGRVLLVETSALELRKGRPVAYLEKGSNEPWPNRGGRGFGGQPRSGVRATKYWPTGTGQNSEYKVVRAHRGQGLAYDTLGKVRDLETCRDLDCRLVLGYRGEWGEEHVERFKFLSGVSVTNPRSPRWQPKMWDRAFTTKPADPRADAIWRDPPK